MNKIKKPVDIVDRTFQFALQIVQICRFMNKKSSTDRILSQQLLCSGTSIGANVEEAQAGQSRADFISKYAIALKEARETKYWLRLIKESGEREDTNIHLLINEADEISKIIGSIITKRNLHTL